MAESITPDLQVFFIDYAVQVAVGRFGDAGGAQILLPLQEVGAVGVAVAVEVAVGGGLERQRQPGGDAAFLGVELDVAQRWVDVALEPLLAD